jgi:putative FmdB family regulatory protein
MPLYEYHCDRSHTVTLLQSFGASKSIKCPSCMDNSAYRIISVPSRAVMQSDCTGAQKGKS